MSKQATIDWIGIFGYEASDPELAKEIMRRVKEAGSWADLCAETGIHMTTLQNRERLLRNERKRVEFVHTKLPRFNYKFMLNKMIQCIAQELGVPQYRAKVHILWLDVKGIKSQNYLVILKRIREERAPERSKQATS